MKFQLLGTIVFAAVSAFSIIQLPAEASSNRVVHGDSRDRDVAPSVAPRVVPQHRQNAPVVVIRRDERGPREVYRPEQRETIRHRDQDRDRRDSRDNYRAPVRERRPHENYTHRNYTSVYTTHRIYSGGGWRVNMWDNRPGWRYDWSWDQGYYWQPNWVHVDLSFPRFFWISEIREGHWQCTAYDSRLNPYPAIGRTIDEAAYNSLYDCGGPYHQDSARGCYIPEYHCEQYIR